MVNKQIKIEQPKQKRKASMILGILSLCFFFTTWPGIVLAIIGLCLDKDEEHKGRDITLNTIGLILSSLWFFYILGTLGY
jgi:hypothetical protein